jgi:hypothetical protein
MGYTKHILYEASVVGLAVVVVGTVISYLIARFEDKDTKFLRNISMFVALFLIGFLLHIGADVSGLNRWYCKNCAGCK